MLNDFLEIYTQNFEKNWKNQRKIEKIMDFKKSINSFKIKRERLLKYLKLKAKKVPHWLKKLFNTFIDWK